jgi:hypothetical protein
MWSNKLRPAERPNYAELRLKQINDSAWYGLVAMGKTQNDIIKRLHAADRKRQAVRRRNLARELSRHSIKRKTS